MKFEPRLCVTFFVAVLAECSLVTIVEREGSPSRCLDSGADPKPFMRSYDHHEGRPKCCLDSGAVLSPSRFDVAVADDVQDLMTGEGSVVL